MAGVTKPTKAAPAKATTTATAKVAKPAAKAKARAKPAKAKTKAKITPKANAKATPQMAASPTSSDKMMMMMTPLQEQQHAPKVATVKLARNSKAEATNSNLAVRRSARRLDACSKEPLTVAEWTRLVVESNPEWAVKLARRSPDQDHKRSRAIFVYGDGHETLVLLDDEMEKIPGTFGSIPTIPIGMSISTFDEDGDDEKIAGFGVLNPGDLIWDHLHGLGQDGEKGMRGPCLFIHTCVTNIWHHASESHRRVLRIATAAPSDPMAVKAIVPDKAFEAGVVAAWSDEHLDIMPPVEDGETRIMFDFRELIALEKAYLEELEPEDVISDGDGPITEEEAKLGLEVIKRAQGEFREYTLRKKRTPKVAASTAASVGASPSNTAAKKPNQASPKAQSKEGEQPDDTLAVTEDQADLPAKIKIEDPSSDEEAKANRAAEEQLITPSDEPELRPPIVRSFHSVPASKSSKKRRSLPKKQRDEKDNGDDERINSDNNEHDRNGGDEDKDKDDNEKDNENDNGSASGSHDDHRDEDMDDSRRRHRRSSSGKKRKKRDKVKTPKAKKSRKTRSAK